MHFFEFSVFTALVVGAYAHGYVDNVTVAGVFYEVSHSYPFLKKAEVLVAQT